MLLAEQKEELYSLIARLLCCNATNVLQGNFIERTVAKEIKSLVEENAFSHLMEVRVVQSFSFVPFCFSIYGYETLLSL